MDWIYALDLIGTMVFAISGVLTAIHNKFDVVGSFIIGIVTAVGGGTLRDILIGETPVGWMKDANYLWVILVALILAYSFRPHITRFRKGMFLFDTIGIGLFTILGLQKTLGVGLSPSIAVMMGTVSAVFGGVIRDVLTGVVPLIFRAEIYATACLAGGGVFLLLENFFPHEMINVIISMITVFAIRFFAVKKKWSLNFSID
ncbi:MAG: trimeric intracellular cation channel family protein [Saprospiraceae bacterium]|jgi:uncharacterized membrane protein YeiH|tara:strand:+ start:559 stop:1164 length:606 start_codon:yes stop_codon:yes gene_type:complete